MAPLRPHALRLRARRAPLVNGRGRGPVLRCLRLLGLGLLVLRRLLLFLLLLWPRLLHRLRGLRVPLWQLPKTGPYGFCDAPLTSLTQEGPGTPRLLGLRCLWPLGALRDGCRV